MFVNKSNQVLQSPHYDKDEIDQLSEYYIEPGKTPSSTQKTIDLAAVQQLSSESLIDFLPEEIRQAPFRRPLRNGLLNFSTNKELISEKLAQLINEQKTPKQCEQMLKERFSGYAPFTKLIEKTFHSHFLSVLQNQEYRSHKKWNDQETQRMLQLYEEGYSYKTIPHVLTYEFKMRFTESMVRYRMKQEGHQQNSNLKPPISQLINRCIKTLMNPQECLEQVRMDHDSPQIEEMVTNEFSKHYAKLKKEILDKPVHNEWSEEETTYLLSLKRQGYDDRLTSILLTHRFDLFFSRQSVIDQIKMQDLKTN